MAGVGRGSSFIESYDLLRGVLEHLFFIVPRKPPVGFVHTSAEELLASFAGMAVQISLANPEAPVQVM